jgi:hypothetical protein
VSSGLGSYTQLWYVATVICIRQKGRGEQDMHTEKAFDKGSLVSLKAAYAAYWASFGVVV